MAIGSGFAAETLGLLPWEPPPPKRGARFGSHPRCWLCGGATDGGGWPRAVAIADTFTNHNVAACPPSDTICQACVATSSGETWRAYCARRPDLGLKSVHPLSWRSYSHAIGPGVDGTAAHPARSGWRPFLLDPPPPPFLFVVAESGQKHLLFRSRVAWDREQFPVQVEEETVWLDRAGFAGCLADVEAALAAGWSRAEELLVIQEVDRLRTETLARRLGRTPKAVRRWCERNRVWATDGGRLTSGWAARASGYTPQALTAMARAGRIGARRVPGGRWWLFDPDALPRKPA